MARLGTEKRPAILRVRTLARAEEVMSLCESKGWQVVVGVEPDEPEDLADLDRLLGVRSDRPATVSRAGPRVGRNDPCPCGSGRKFKRCCGR